MRSNTSDRIRSEGISAVKIVPAPPLKDNALIGTNVDISMDVMAFKGFRSGSQPTVMEAIVTVELPGNARVLTVQRHGGVTSPSRGSVPARSSIPDVYTVTVLLAREAVTQTISFSALRSPAWTLAPGYVHDVLWRTDQTYGADRAPFALPSTKIRPSVERGDYTVTAHILEGETTNERKIAKRYVLVVHLPSDCDVLGVQRHEGTIGTQFARSEAFTVTMKVDGVVRTHTFDFTALELGDWTLGATGLERIHWRMKR